MRWKTFGIVACATGLMGIQASAFGATQSLRPVLRPVQDAAQGVESVAVQSPAVRPKLRPSDLATAPVPVVTKAASDPGFARWISGFERRARAQGIRADVLTAAFRGVQYDPDVIRRDRNQSEFTKTIWEYLDSAASDTRIRNGKAALRKHNRKLDAIEKRYGVDKEVVVAVWGLESAYGEYRGSNDIVQSLATLAYDGRRGKFFEQQLVAALKIIQNGDTSPRNMTGSWAGAMGHTQFIPTSYLAYAVDFTGDGRRDIWSDDPSDALASTAAYLARFGWVKGQPWGVEVQLPKGFNYALANRKTTKSPGQWGRLGVVGINGRAVPNYGNASILLPAGGQGAAFMIFKNFSVIERYNTADAYVIGVGHLSDRIKGGPAIKASWPRGDRALTFAERKEMQQRLTRAGFSTQGVDGKIGPKTIEAVRAYQRSKGLAPDGYASLSLLNRLR
ncbi:lytic murein transglycosylase [Roseobacter sp. YSTF-M11]|uniref:Lytic murein transglycosylase n=1 Tax=Roseobacter insulae TaxID=2859783 RepID=A0A9X1JXG5_9RHOB|nr:lytic murein transglycosylase [Roseobacter insulae]MBW4706951.1 lytic murein transglycosylase [Roseobacter insulae]